MFIDYILYLLLAQVLYGLIILSMLVVLTALWLISRESSFRANDKRNVTVTPIVRTANNAAAVVDVHPSNKIANHHTNSLMHHDSSVSLLSSLTFDGAPKNSIIILPWKTLESLSSISSLYSPLSQYTSNIDTNVATQLQPSSSSIDIESVYAIIRLATQLRYLTIMARGLLHSLWQSAQNQRILSAPEVSVAHIASPVEAILLNTEVVDSQQIKVNSEIHTYITPDESNDMNTVRTNSTDGEQEDTNVSFGNSAPEASVMPITPSVEAILLNTEVVDSRQSKDNSETNTDITPVESINTSTVKRTDSIDSEQEDNNTSPITSATSTCVCHKRKSPSSTRKTTNVTPSGIENGCQTTRRKRRVFRTKKYIKEEYPILKNEIEGAPSAMKKISQSTSTITTTTTTTTTKDYTATVSKVEDMVTQFLKKEQELNQLRENEKNYITTLKDMETKISQLETELNQKENNYVDKLKYLNSKIEGLETTLQQQETSRINAMKDLELKNVKLEMELQQREILHTKGMQDMKSFYLAEREKSYSITVRNMELKYQTAAQRMEDVWIKLMEETMARWKESIKMEVLPLFAASNASMDLEAFRDTNAQMCPSQQDQQNLHATK